jgi:hypothetical protein
MDPQKKRLLLLAGVGIALLYLYSRAKGSSPTAQAAAADPLQGVAQQLQAQQLQQQAQLQFGAAQLKQQEASTLEQFNLFKQLAADPAYACPNGGRPRWIVGQGPGCIGPKTGAITFGSLLGAAEQAFSVFAGPGSVRPAAGSTPTAPGGTPPIARSFF